MASSGGWAGLRVVQHGQDIGHACAVVRAQGGAPGPEIALLDIEIQGVGLKVVRAALLLGPHHIHVGLDGQGGAVLITG